MVSRQTVIDSTFATVVCAPIFSNWIGLSTQVAVGESEGLKHSSAIYCDNLVSVSKEELTNFVGTLSGPKLADLDIALRIALDLE